MQRTGDAEVHDLDGAAVRDDHVRGLDVTVHDAVLVAVGQRLQYTGDDDQRLVRRRGVGVQQQIADGVALDQLHHDVRHGVAADQILTGVVDRDHGMVVQPGHGLRLTREAGLGNRVLGEVGTQQLHGDGTAETDILGCEHLRHATAAQPSREPVAAIADQPAIAPHLRCVGDIGAGGLRIGRALGALRRCHRSSPSNQSA